MGKEKPPVTATGAEVAIIKPKEKRRSNEKRKEKSRDAARCRRSRETDLFTELADGLPVRRDEVEQLDKASVMRLAISFLKIHDVIKYFPQIKELQVKNETAVNNKEDSTNDNDDVDEEKPFDRFWNNKDTIQLLNNCLDGFLMILSSDGDITYSSESISEYLGISQIDILGNPVWEYIHQCDHEELKEALNIRKNSLQDTVKDENDKEESEFKTCHRDLFLRFKCTLTSRGRSVNIKSASYKVIHFVGHMIINKEGERILIAVGRPIPHPSNIEIPLGTTTFLTKHSLDMKFTYVDEKMQQELHYKADDLLGKSLYNYHHSCDSESLMVTFKSALSKGQGETCRYRFLGKNGGYCWLVTQATTVYDKQKPQSVVCVNYMISQLENENEIYSYEQFEAAKNKDQRKKILCNNNNINNIKSDEININNKNNTINNNSSNQKQQNTSENKLNKIQQITTNNNEVPIITQTTKPSSSSTATIFNKKLNEQNLVTNFVNQNQQIRENSLSPLRQTLKNFNITKQQQQQQLQQQQQQQQQKDLTVPKLTSLKSSSDINKSYDDDDDNNDNDIVINTNFYLTDPKKSKDINLKNCNINNNNNSNCNKVTINKKISVVDCGSVRQQPQQQQEQQKITTTQFTNNKIPPQPQRIEDSKKPKSVTASVFTQVKPNERTSILLNTNAQFNVASRAQSVTASIFKPISQVTQNLLLTAKQNINNGFNNNNNNGNGIINNRNNNNTNTNNISVDKNNKINNNNINNNIVSGIQQQNSIIPKVQIQSTSTLLSTSLLTSNPPSIEKQRRSEDMNKGYISFTEDSDLTMLKEEPDDLTQLTSSAGDSCLPLDDSTPLFGEMLESLILPDSYSSLLPDEINSLDSQQSNNQNNNCNNNNNNNNNNKNGVGPPIDPFINYRDDTSDTASSPHLLSPGGLSKSPEASSLPSLCSPHSLSQEDEFAFMTMNVEDDIDLSMRAPYIPMNENDDLPLLTDDLMWSTFSEELSLHKDMKDVMQIHDNMTALKNQINQTNHNNCYNSNSNNSNNINNNNSNSNCLTTQLNSIAQSHVQQQQQQHQSTPIIATSILQTTNNINLINNNNNNNNIINQNQVNESSLINLLCNNNNSNNNSNNNDDNIISNKLQSDDDINYKKRKYIEDNLCDSIDAFGPVFNNKGCSNLDCWSVSDLLQLDQENIQFNDKSQNILISNLTNGIGTTLATSNSSTSPILSTISPISTSTGTTTIHVPLITIQNNQKINNQINNNLNNKINLQLKDENHCTKSILDNQIINNNNNNNQNNNNKSTITPRILNSCNNNNNINTSQVNTVKLIPHSTIILNGSNITAANNKRHIIGTATTLDSKRIKCSENSSLLTKTTTLTSSVTSTGTNTTSSTPRMHINVGGIQHNQQQHNEPRMQNVEIQTTPHLLQQLIAAPNPKQQQQQQQQQKDNQRNQKNISGMDNKYQNSKKDNDELIINRNHNNHLEHLKLRQQQQLQQQQQQHSPSNSVLKNLLVSGCDGTSPLPPLITDDENSQESIGINTNQMSPCTYYQRPYNCRNVTAQLIRNCGANPMIGGPTMLPSPPIPSEFFNTTSISNFSSNNENDMSNDSGFDDVGNGNGINKNSFTKLTFNEIAFDLQKQLEMKNKTTTSSMLSPIPPIDINRNYNQQSNDYNQNENYTSEDRGGGGGGTYLNQHNINKRLNTINSGGKYKAVVNRTSSPIESISNQQNYFKNNFDNQSSSSVNNDNIPPLIKSGAGDEKMIIDDNENDVKLTSLPLIDESSTSPFENTFLMDFDDFLTDNWANSLI